MPRHATLLVPKDDWVELTNVDVTNITFQNNGRDYVLIQGTMGSVKPTSSVGAPRYNPRQGERNAALTDLFPGVDSWLRGPATSVICRSCRLSFYQHALDRIHLECL